MNYFSIAIDGPAGAGKSTIARKIAARLGFIYVDTGAMYRAIALYLIRNGIKAGEEERISGACREADVTIRYENGEQVVLLNGENVNGLIRTEEAGKMASAAAVNHDVRLKLVELQRKLAGEADVIMDGRDIGTFVLPDAGLKIYLTASSKERARRRCEELAGKGISCSPEEVERDIIARDEQDMNRDFAPLKQAEDAIVVDSSHMSIEEVVDTIIGYYKGAKR
ncbi:(d)CMP kinase [Anaerolentibacter hominis]|uniref:(d)CMP kinase n=1 Tax=Anaerolentibacter hominis TaxID=3079009 RepID=UPI0031B80AA0